ncbi:chorismate mutase [Treponema sp. R80B11-R83G3]
MKKLYALRGAVQCENTTDDMILQIGLMYGDLLNMNKLEEADIVSVMFSVTDDLYAINPCTALRRGGRAGELSLFSTQEPKSKNSLERVVRVLIHCYLDEGTVIRHVYLNGAEVLLP